MSNPQRRSPKNKNSKEAQSESVRQAMDHVFLGSKVISELRILMRLASPGRVRKASDKLSAGSEA